MKQNELRIVKVVNSSGEETFSIEKYRKWGKWLSMWFTEKNNIDTYENATLLKSELEQQIKNPDMRIDTQTQPVYEQREFTVICLVGTKLHKVGEIYKVVTYVKPDSWFYVYDIRGHSYEVYTDFFNFQKSFKIIK